ncbi:hypothetical protein IPJ70_02075 [Candidatus Campbellbacteria bacterium]|nr:MAG: hypothetical protein IPJ70_02075 [Candidatus Campbellbacteria bacterium]
MFEKYKKIIGIVLGILVLFVVYMVFKPKAEAPLSATTTAAAALSGQDSELLALLSQLNAIKLNGAFFTDQLFLSLTDFSVNLAPEPRQRPNPFAPIGSDGVSANTQQGTSSVAKTGL